MNEIEIKQIAREIGEAMRGRRFGKIFPLSATSFAFDFHPHAGSYLFVDLGPQTGAAFLIVRKLKELERSATHSSPFIIQLRRTLTGREFTNVSVDASSIRLELSAAESDTLTLVIQLRGGTPNAFVVDIKGVISEAARNSDRDGQKVGDVYAGPQIDQDAKAKRIDPRGGTLSCAIDTERRQRDAETRFALLAKEARKKIKSDLTKRQKLLSNLDSDLAQHGNAEKWKKFGDLILANISNLRRESDTIYVTNYFDPEMPEIAITADHNQPPTEVAEGYFRKYTKARNAVAAIGERKKIVNAEIERLERRKEAIESAIATQDEEKLSSFVTVKIVEPQISKEKKKADKFTGARKFISSDGFEILVGKKAKDNDHLTFRIAKAYDTWLHAADYPGSHVIIRNPNRKEIPVRTLLEAAQLAAFYSDAREKPKAAVNYTLKKFVNKPKRAAPGLASLSSFKTILVEPGFPEAVGKA
ncbi:MAG: NFACT RNA binding domain-containing protein [Pyrinomonadaceae bacterium]